MNVDIPPAQPQLKLMLRIDILVRVLNGDKRWHNGVPACATPHKTLAFHAREMSIDA